ncbi:hypothetical protein [Flexivirga oryzae]|uniref:Uncharacterized protein n=1 Tax=Flexivirga oryzae TaxID=1794944 RepID=A0A839MYJ1_9MICO|nr:hypothetical protein [Flexivirga oryzae]MBB2890530.1 hypothetical protein [Flexivirga oryzae]
MGIFGWGKKQDEPDAGGPRDADLPTLSADQARELGRMVRNQLADRGTEALVDRGTLRLADGRQLGLHNLAVQASGLPYAEWPALVGRHLDLLMGHWQREREGNDQADPERVLAKLRIVADLPEEARREDAPQPLPGVVALLAEDRPEIVVEFFDPGRVDVPDPWALARRNLRALPLPEHRIVGDEPGGDVHVFLSEDFFGASRLLVLPDLLARVGAHLPQAGALVAVPNRHLLLVHLLVGAPVVQALNWMVGVAAQEYPESPGPVSPHVYHLTPQLHAQQVTAQGPDGGTVVEVRDQFEAAFRLLGLLGDGPAD